MEIKLSILIATMPSRRIKFLKLINRLHLFSKGMPIEILFDESMAYNIGAKRNSLLSRAKGEYIVYVDDDDRVPNYYTAAILDYLQSNPDCLGISGKMTTNGRDERQWHISKEYGSWFEREGVYYRTPNHISPVRRELALQAGFPEIPFAEDAEYSRRLLPLLKTEVIIPANLYYYDYETNK